jgi:glyoxalase family protein
VIRTFLRVRGEESLGWWARRLESEGLASTGVVEVDGRRRIEFQDPEGQRLGLVDDGGTGDEPTPWEESEVPAEHQIRGLGPIVLSVPTLEGTDRVLTEVMGMDRVRRYAHLHEDESAVGEGKSGDVHVYRMGSEGPHAELHVAVQPHLPPAGLGAGGVHHVAFRTPDDEYDAWAERLNDQGVPNSGPVDRFYFRSLYFREPAGILFEIASDGPGFAVDEDVEDLGESLVLPPFLEPQREKIVAGLRPIE